MFEDSIVAKKLSTEHVISKLQKDSYRLIDYIYRFIDDVKDIWNIWTFHIFFIHFLKVSRAWSPQRLEAWSSSSPQWCRRVEGWESHWKHITSDFNVEIIASFGVYNGHFNAGWWIGLDFYRNLIFRMKNDSLEEELSFRCHCLFSGYVSFSQVQLVVKTCGMHHIHPLILSMSLGFCLLIR